MALVYEDVKKRIGIYIIHLSKVKKQMIVQCG